MPALIAILAGAGIPERLRTAAAWFVAALFLALVCCLLALAFRSWLHGREEAAVQIDRADVTAEAASRVLAADRAATANQIAADAAFQNSQEGLRDEVREKGTDDPVGPATAGVLERLRNEQRAAAH